MLSMPGYLLGKVTPFAPSAWADPLADQGNISFQGMMRATQISVPDRPYIAVDGLGNTFIRSVPTFRGIRAAKQALTIPVEYIQAVLLGLLGVPNVEDVIVTVAIGGKRIGN